MTPGAAVVLMLLFSAVIWLAVLLPVWWLWTAVVPAIWPAGPVEVTDPGYWTFVGVVLLVKLIGTLLFGVSVSVKKD